MFFLQTAAFALIYQAKDAELRRVKAEAVETRVKVEQLKRKLRYQLDLEGELRATRELEDTLREIEADRSEPERR